MAISTTVTAPTRPFDNYDTTSTGQSTIKPQTEKLELLATSLEFDQDIIINNNMDKDQIKIDLVKKLAEEMFKSDKIEFTQQLDPIQNRRIFRAYTYVGSKQMVSILRGQNQPLSQDKIERIHDTLIKSGYNIPPTVLVDIIDLVDNMRSAP